MSLDHVAITGAATGIGAETARILRARGARVTALDIAEPAGEVDGYVPVDLADPVSIDAAAAALAGPFDALCNVAGLPPREGLTALELRVNFLGLRRLTHALLDKLCPGASIVNVASRAGARWRDNLDQVKALLALDDDADMDAFCAQHGIDHVRAYDLSKEAVIVWTMTQTEPLLARGLRINSVSPAAIETAILGDFETAFGERMARNVARVGRVGTPTEVAEVVAFLASPASGWIKGVDVGVDGGTLALNMADVLGV